MFKIFSPSKWKQVGTHTPHNLLILFTLKQPNSAEQGVKEEVFHLSPLILFLENRWLLLWKWILLHHWACQLLSPWPNTVQCMYWRSHKLLYTFYSKAFFCTAIVVSTAQSNTGTSTLPLIMPTVKCSSINLKCMKICTPNLLSKQINILVMHKY